MAYIIEQKYEHELENEDNIIIWVPLKGYDYPDVCWTDPSDPNPMIFETEDQAQKTLNLLCGAVYRYNENDLRISNF
jgi:hypothetical protein